MDTILADLSAGEMILRIIRFVLAMLGMLSVIGIPVGVGMGIALLVMANNEPEDKNKKRKRIWGVICILAPFILLFISLIGNIITAVIDSNNF
ncbi:hypothetical protein EPO05_04240 [Patescibacteria group bacterium]|nr:MAG: hypothetical protein EPO05_04240 [Patescibacteria group bacterium]